MRQHYGNVQFLEHPPKRVKQKSFLTLNPVKLRELPPWTAARSAGGFGRGIQLWPCVPSDKRSGADRPPDSLFRLGRMFKTCGRKPEALPDGSRGSSAATPPDYGQTLHRPRRGSQTSGIRRLNKGADRGRLNATKTNHPASTPSHVFIYSFGCPLISRQ